MKYYLMKNENEIKSKQNLKICCTTENTENAEIIATFDNLKEARKTLANYNSNVEKVYTYSSYVYIVTEYYIQEADDYGDYWDFSKLNINVYLYNRMTNTKEVIATFDNYNDALNFKRNYEHNNDIDDDIFVEIDVDNF